MSSSKFDRFGKVFVRQKRAVQDGGDSAPFVEVEGAKFSNIQLSVIPANENGEKFHGKRWHTRVFGHRLNFPKPLGATKFVDEGLFESAFEELINAMVEFGIVDKNNEKAYSAVRKKMRPTDFHIWAVLGVSDSTVERARDLRYFTTFLAHTMFDDCLEAVAANETNEIGWMERNSEKTEKESKISNEIPFVYICKLVYECVKLGRTERIKRLENIVEEFEKLAKTGTNFERVFLRTWAVIYKEAVLFAERHGGDAEPFLREFDVWNEYAAIEFSTEWKVGIMGCDEKANKMVDVLARLRDFTIGGTLTLEVLLLQNCVIFDDDLRQSALFKMIERLAGSWCRSVNDFYSFDKEMRSHGNDWRSNEGCMLHKVKGYSKEEAITKLVNDANEKLAQIEVLCDVLLDSWKEEGREQVRLFIGQVYHLIGVTIQGHAVVQRYHQNLVLDCYIDNV